VTCGLLPEPGFKEIAVYGDGSFCHESLAGAWATHVPALGIQLSGFGSGPSANHFEFFALVEGIRAVVAVDYTTRPLHLCTDNQSVAVVLRHLCSRTDLPPRKGLDHVRDLYARATDLLRARAVRWSNVNGESSYHRICHNAARAALREFVRGRFPLDYAGLLKREELRRNDLIGERERLEAQLKRVQTRLRSCEGRIAQWNARNGAAEEG
jgi:ribonuclease HI